MKLAAGRSAAGLLSGSLVLFLLVGCAEDSSPAGGSETVQTAPAVMDSVPQRWYSEAQVEQGAAVFARHCATCHGDQAQGLTADWRQRLDDGSFPPPPLNGSAHAWHHPLPQLLQVIDTGGVPYGGQMPPFRDVLSDQEKQAAIAYFQGFWNDEIYLAWLDRGGLD